MDVHYHPEFSDDLVAAAKYLEDQQPGLGERFLDKVEQTCRDVMNGPLLNSYIDRPVRRRQVDPFSYAVHYELVDPETLFFYGCYHGALNPEKWSQRYEAD